MIDTRSQRPVIGLLADGCLRLQQSLHYMQGNMDPTAGLSTTFYHEGLAAALAAADARISTWAAAIRNNPLLHADKATGGAGLPASMSGT